MGRTLVPRAEGAMEPGFFRRAWNRTMEWFGAYGVDPWPAVLEVTLEYVQPKSDFEKVADLLNKEMTSAPGAADVAAAAATAAGTAPDATGAAALAVASAEASEM